MLGNKDAIATIAVKDLKTAGRFYTETLGLKRASDGDEPSTATFTTGNTTLLVYESQYAGTNQATAATWNVTGELDQIVKTLKSRGVDFEHYDLPGLKLEGDIHVGDGLRVAWFKDPDGNIHSLYST